MGWDPDATAGSTGLETDDAQTDGEKGTDSDAPGTSTGPEGDESGDLPTGGPVGTCNPGMERQCLCEDGLHLGLEVCDDAGGGWGPCACDEGSGGEDTTGGDVAPTEVC